MKFVILMKYLLIQHKKKNFMRCNTITNIWFNSICLEIIQIFVNFLFFLTYNIRCWFNLTKIYRSITFLANQYQFLYIKSNSLIMKNGKTIIYFFWHLILYEDRFIGLTSFSQWNINYFSFILKIAEIIKKPKKGNNLQSIFLIDDMYGMVKQIMV